MLILLNIFTTLILKPVKALLVPNNITQYRFVPKVMTDTNITYSLIIDGWSSCGLHYRTYLCMHTYVVRY